jgi:hypothetical protein
MKTTVAFRLVGTFVGIVLIVSPLTLTSSPR